ncbi:hypothetical protein M422DRAFT_274907 [Sphaerobolus stellatus SS14]|uniref:Uncharacterized protein n=1 Tax=Sphaerobolus stellatus (strain SS14) TaxID=990650 RepID=A0A0C9U5F6_SPHS4|nr:hypothetical protein M422DRAFT_274907 [Sphaerobolus stellatus SS14]
MQSAVESPGRIEDKVSDEEFVGSTVNSDTVGGGTRRNTVNNSTDVQTPPSLEGNDRSTEVIIPLTSDTTLIGVLLSVDEHLKIWLSSALL